MLYENRIAEIPRESYENIACERCPNNVVFGVTLRLLVIHFVVVSRHQQTRLLTSD